MSTHINNLPEERMTWKQGVLYALSLLLGGFLALLVLSCCHGCTMLADKTQVVEANPVEVQAVQLPNYLNQAINELVGATQLSVQPAQKAKIESAIANINSAKVVADKVVEAAKQQGNTLANLAADKDKAVAAEKAKTKAAEDRYEADHALNKWIGWRTRTLLYIALGSYIFLQVAGVLLSNSNVLGVGARVGNTVLDALPLSNVGYWFVKKESKL